MIASVGTVTMIGMMLGSLILSPLADKFGRRPMNIVFLLVYCISMWMVVGAMLIRGSYIMLLTSCFLGGLVTLPLLAVMTVYTTELSTLEMTTLCTAAGFFSEGIVLIMIGFYFIYFKDCAIFYFIISISMTLFLIFYAIFC